MGSVQEDKRYQVDTFTYACSAHVRATLRRALKLQSQHNVWQGTEYVNSARGMVAGPGMLPDEPVWRLTKLELRTIQRALEWRESLASYQRYSPELRQEWSRISDEITQVLRSVKYGM